VCPSAIAVDRDDTPTTAEMGNAATSKKGDANENGKQAFDDRSTTAEHAVSKQTFCKSLSSLTLCFELLLCVQYVGPSTL